MSKQLKLTVGIGLSLVVLLISLVFFLRHLLTKSFPITEGTISLPGLHEEVVVYRDRLGVPHIRGTDEHDMFFAQGYVHGQDRLWQMDMIRRTAQGRLSEILGAQTLEYDKLFRTLDLEGAAAGWEKSLHPETQQVLAAYAAGVNAFVTQNADRLPIEFDMLKYRPDVWEPRHSIMIARMIAWELNMASMTDLPLGMILSKLDATKASEAVPGASGDTRTSLAELKDTLSLNLGENARWGTWFLETNYRFRTSSGSEALSGGSNCWAISPKRSISDRPILANDLHLAMPVPSLWYQVHLRCAGWNVAGASLPGTPLVIVGRNDALAWGLTNAMIDDADFYVERSDSSGTRYAVQDRWVDVESSDEWIYVGEEDSVLYTRRKTRHGPVVDEIISGNGRFLISMKWTGFEASDEFRAFYLINRSTNAREFEAGVRELEVPGQNVVYADTFGNVGHWVAARIPVRREIDPMFPLPGWTSEAEWRGFIPFGQLPRSWNPTEGFIASANNPFVGENYPQYVSELWEPPSRITRIRELLNSAEKLNSEDCERFQTDILSPHGKEFTEHLLRVFPNQETTDPILSTALEYLRNWDFRYSRDNIAPTVISSTFVRFLQNVFKDELGDTLFTLYTAFSAVPHRVTSRMLESDSSGWFDDIATPEVESKDDILRRSLLDALQELQSIMGPDTKLWRWGELHTVTFVHPFGRQKPLDRVFNIGPFSIGGSSSTIRKSDFRLSKPYAVTVGPSVRHVIDLGNRSSFLSVITAGASGQVLHEHYDDQSVLWLNGGYHTFITEWDMISQAGWDRLVLRPE